MNITPIEIDINEWECFGGGFMAESFYKKDDDHIMLKLYAPSVPGVEVYDELCISEKISKLGLPIAVPVSYAKSGDRYGAVFERIKNKRSIARIIADEPERVDEMGKLFADMLKMLHSTECDTKLFPDMQALCLKEVLQSPFITETQRSKAVYFLSSLPKNTGCVHGDCHLGNIVINKEQGPIFIDLADFSYGNPLFDLGTSYFMAQLIPDEMCFNLFHVHLDVMNDFWQSVVKYYFPGERLEDVNESLKPFAGFRAVHLASKSVKSDAVLERVFVQAFGE